MSATPEDCFHLSIETVVEIHVEAIRQFGGLGGVRDENLLASAVLAPQSTFGGKSPYHDLVEIAAAYLFYICKNHPFIDGNKRTALMAAIVFLRINGIEPLPDSAEWETRCSTRRRARSIVTKPLAGFAHCSRNPEEAKR